MKFLSRSLLALAIAAAIAFGSAPAYAQAPPAPAPVSIVAGSVPLSVSSTSANVALPGTAIGLISATLNNTGGADAYCVGGGSSVVATTSSPIYVAAGTHVDAYVGAATYIACITASSTTTVVAYHANGPFNLGGAGSGGPLRVQGCTGCTAVQTIGSARTVAATLTRPNNTTTYTANTGINTATSASSPGYGTLTGICSVNGGAEYLNDVYVTDEANQTTKLQATLWLFNVAPTTIINDNAAFNVASGDWTSARPPIPMVFSTVMNATSGSGGAVVVDVQPGVLVNCASGDTNLYYMMEANNAYVPIASEAFLIRVKVIDQSH